MSAGLSARPEARPRVLGLLVGDIAAPASGARVKYGQLFAELGARCDLLGVADVDLRGPERLVNALLTMRPGSTRWRSAFQKSFWGHARRSRRARRALARHTPDVALQHGAIFHAHTPHGPPVVIYTDFTYRLAQRDDRWRNPFGAAAGERWDQLELAAYRGAALLLTRSELARRSLLEDYGLPPERVVTVGGGVNFARLPDPPPPASPPRVLFIGKEFERKGGDLLLAAFAIARERVPSAELWMLTGRDVAAPGVRRIAPTYDRAAIAALYRQAGVFALPSRSETWGDVFLEAMAHGLPCVGARSDAVPEIVAHGETGLLAPPGDVLALADALTALLADQALRRRMGARGRERVASAFTWGHVADRIASLLADVAASPPLKSAR